MSANLLVDIGSTSQHAVSLVSTVAAQSGGAVGGIVDLNHSDTYCNLFLIGGAGSGAVRVQVQTSDSATSGTFTDPTSGRAAGDFPTYVGSGGIFTANSGVAGSGNMPGQAPVSGAAPWCSGGVAFGAFIRTGRYARLVLLSGGGVSAPLVGGFVSQLRTTGSGAGFSWSPQEGGSVNV